MLPNLLCMTDLPDALLSKEGAWIWRTSIDETVDASILNEEELARIRQLVDPAMRRSLAAHLVSRREIIGRLTSRTAANVPLIKDRQGAPWIDASDAPRISLSRSGSWNALASSQTTDIGIDIEHLRQISWEPILHMICAPEEADIVRGLLLTGMEWRPFFRLWTVKESVLKAARLGLRGGAANVHVPELLLKGDAVEADLSYGGATYRVAVTEPEEVIVACARRLSPNPSVIRKWV
ncbi:MAG: 4'-phosphopantetheinyl transferase superfamily protein [Hyphomonas sp.]|uniref:4'-phosphopantetheinyl transferase family protein n=1 Tax=Hyphomonas sp. TaxID=87 RepID=UPI003528334D